MTNHSGDFSRPLVRSYEALVKHIEKIHSADAIEIINSLDFKDTVAVFIQLPIQYVIELFNKPELQRTAKILESLPPDRAVLILDGMSADETADVFQEMDKQIRQRLFVKLQPLTRSELKKLTRYPEQSAGSLMTTEFIAVSSTWVVQRTLDYIREFERARETFYTAYIIDPNTSRLLSAISLRRLVLAKPEDNVLDAAEYAEPITITALTDRKDVARFFRRYDLLSIPVVDEDKHVIGIVTVDDVLDAMTEEMSKDTHKFGGMEALEKPYMHISFFEMLKKRGGWLCLLFLGEMFTTSAMQYFEHELEKAIILTLFIPLIMSSGGNSGSQTTSLIIRAFALREIEIKDWWRTISRELPIGFSLGGILGIIGFIRVAVWQWSGIYDYGEYWFLIALTLCCTLIAVVSFGSLIGSMLPFILKILYFDPASASAPFVATFVDVTGIIIYFSIAANILSGTLL